VGGEIYLDLNYQEDLNAEVDLNISMLEDGSIVDIQGTGEGSNFNIQELIKLIEVARKGINLIIEEEKKLFF
jgi:ribonuclease PH